MSIPRNPFAGESGNNPNPGPSSCFWLLAVPGFFLLLLAGAFLMYMHVLSSDKKLDAMIRSEDNIQLAQKYAIKCFEGNELIVMAVYTKLETGKDNFVWLTPGIQEHTVKQYELSVKQISSSYLTPDYGFYLKSQRFAIAFNQKMFSLVKNNLAIE